MAFKSDVGGWSNASESTLVEEFPLHRACRDGDSELLSELLRQNKDDRKASLSLEDTYYGWTPCHWAAYFGKLDCLRMLVLGGSGTDECPADLRTTRFSQTPAHIAAFAGHPHCLQWLIQANADPNAKDYLGETALHKAARTGAQECISLLTNCKNVDALIKNTTGQTADQLAQACGTADRIVEYLTSFRIKQEESGKPFISSNGYYGFHPSQTIGSKPTEMDSDSAMEMETDESSPVHNEHTSPNGDITLSFDISQNRVPVGGKKRCREEMSSAPEMKRLRMEGPEKPIRPSPVFLPSLANNNGKESCPIAACSVREHYQSVIVEKGYDAINYHTLMADAHGC